MASIEKNVITECARENEPSRKIAVRLHFGLVFGTILPVNNANNVC